MRKMTHKAIYVLLFTVLGVISSHGQILKYSDLNTTTKRPKGGFGSYEASNGTVYNIGDTLIIGTPSQNNSFAFIYEGTILTGYDRAGVQVTGNKSEILKIEVQGTKRSGFYAHLVSKSAVGLGIKLRVDLENALEAGEIKSSRMTSDEALAELKKAKDKLDLGVISEEEYEKIKAELIKYIN